MGDDFGAGSISVEMRAQFENLATGILQAQQQLNAFTDTAQKAGEKVRKAGQDISDGFDSGSLGSLRAQERFAKSAAQMIVMQNSLTQLSAHAQQSFGQINVAANAGAMGLEKFLIIFGSFPTPTTAALGIVIGLAEALMVASRAIDQITKKMDDLNNKLEKTRQKFIGAAAKEEAKTAVLPGVQGDIQSRIDGETKGLEKLVLLQHEYDDAVAQEASQRTGIENQIKAEQDRLLLLLKAQQEAKERGFTFDAGMIQGAYDSIDKLNQQLGKLVGKMIDSGNAIHNTGKTTEEYVQTIQNLKLALDFSKTLDSLNKTGEALKQMTEISKVELGVGLVTPLQATDEVLRAMRRDVDETIKAIVDLQKAADLAGSDDELRQILTTRADELKSYLGGKVQNLQRQETISQSQKTAGELGGNLARSIGDAVSQGILNGEKAMQVLADVGKNLFSNMLSTAVQDFQKGMVKAFQSIAGTGGEVLGTALTGVLGIVGGILGRSRSGSTNYNAIQSQIQSTEAVRGIVAGPTNVAIEAVGQDLTRANKPVVDKLEEIRVALINLRLSGGGAGGFQFAGSVSTP